MICFHVEKTVESKEEMEAIGVVLILMSMYNLICCNVDEENVESKKEMEAIGVATSGTDNDEYVLLDMFYYRGRNC